MERRNITSVSISDVPVEHKNSLEAHRFFEHARLAGLLALHNHSGSYKAGEKTDLTLGLGDPYVLLGHSTIRGFFHHDFGIEVVTDDGSRIIPMEKVITFSLTEERLSI